MALLVSVYARDEDLLVAAPGDYSLLVPDHQMVASGTDGVFTASPSGSWVLTSTSALFLARGVSSGQVVVLSKPTAVFRKPDLLVVDAVDISGVTLRRASLSPGQGPPPGPVSGLTGVEFRVLTLFPQIERASYTLNRRFGIDDRIIGHEAGSLYDPRELNEATVNRTLEGICLAMARMAGLPQDDWAAKAKYYRERAESVEARLTIHFEGRQNVPDVAGSFTTKLLR